MSQYQTIRNTLGKEGVIERNQAEVLEISSFKMICGVMRMIDGTISSDRVWFVCVNLLLLMENRDQIKMLTNPMVQVY